MENGREKYGRYLMHCIKNDSFADLSKAYANLGDSIQALAIDSIYKQIGIKEIDIQYIRRDYAKEYNGVKTKVPFYSEFAKGNIVNRLTMSKDLVVKILLSAVFYNTFEELELALPGCYNIVKSMEPISARDEMTANYLSENGIEAYLTGCFTICFPKRKKIPSTQKTFFVDVPKSLDKYIPNHLKMNCEYITHAVPIKEYPISEKENNRLESISRELLERYKEEATLVVTSRLHAAIPCIAFGIPVVFASTNIDFRFSWVEKLFHPYQFEEFSQIDWTPKVIDVEEIKQRVISIIQKALNDQPFIEDMKWLDSFYRDRERTKLYMHFNTIIEEIGELHKKNPHFTYLIWGAGYHCEFAIKLMEQINPSAVPVVIVDRYKKGRIKGVEIFHPEEIPQMYYEHMIISTVPGLHEAIEWHDRNIPDVPYSLIISDQKS